MLKESPLANSEQTLVSSEMGAAQQELRVEVLASGLDGPRGLTFGSDGALYVTEAGRGDQEPVFLRPVSPVQFCLMAQRVRLPGFRMVKSSGL